MTTCRAKSDHASQWVGLFIGWQGACPFFGPQFTHFWPQIAHFETIRANFEPKTNMNERREEYYTYDIGDLLGDIGGYLGLWLGWSVLTFFKEMPIMAVKVLTICKRTFLTMILSSPNPFQTQ